MDHVISEMGYKWDTFTRELQENDHVMVIFLEFYSKLPWLKNLGTTT